MNFIRKIMQGRHGADHFTLGLLAFSIFLSLVAGLTKVSLFAILSYPLLVFGLYRTFSKKTYKRREENIKFLRAIAPIRQKIASYQRRFKDRKNFKYFTCPTCKKESKVPKNKGRIMITCPNCKKRFEGRS